MLLANHGAVTCGTDVMAAYYKMETIEHFATISLVARLLGGENLISREEVERLQGLRGCTGFPRPAPLCADPSAEPADAQVACQVLEAPNRRRTDVSCPTDRSRHERDGESHMSGERHEDGKFG